MPQATETTAKPARPSRRRFQTVDIAIVLAALASIGLVTSATFTTRAAIRQAAGPNAAVADAITTLRRTFGYDGVAHELDQLRRSADPAALSALGDSLRAARGAIGLLRKQLGETDPIVPRALDQLESAARRLESLLRSERGDLSARIVDLPLLEPLFVLDQATQALDDAASATGAVEARALLWVTVAVGCMVAAICLLLAGWIRLSLLTPLRQLASDVADGTRTAAARLSTRSDEFGLIAAALGGRADQAQPIHAGTSDLPALLQGQGQMLVQIRQLIEELAARPASTNEPEAAAVGEGDPIAIGTNEPEHELAQQQDGAAAKGSTNEPEPVRSNVLHSIVELVAKEQVRRHQGSQQSQDEPIGDNDRLINELVDRVLTRLDQVTERVTTEHATPARRAS